MTTQAQLCGQLRVELATLEGLLGPLEEVSVTFSGPEDASQVLETFVGYLRTCSAAVQTKIDSYQALAPSSTVAAQEYDSSRARTSLYLEKNAVVVRAVEDGWKTADELLYWISSMLQGLIDPLVDGPHMLVSGMKEVVKQTKEEINVLVREIATPVRTTAVGAGILILILMVVAAFFAWKELR